MFFISEILFFIFDILLFVYEKPCKLKRINTGVLSPTLFNIYTSDVPLPPKDVQTTTYADEITMTASYTKHRKAQQLIQPYLHNIYEWANTNNFYI